MNFDDEIFDEQLSKVCAKGNEARCAKPGVCSDEGCDHHLLPGAVIQLHRRQRAGHEAGVRPVELHLDGE